MTRLCVRSFAVGIILGCYTLAAGADGRKVPVGVYAGEGRVCYGKLRITEKTLNWNWHSGRCKAGYRLSKVESGEGWVSYTLQTVASKASCAFSDIVLVEHPGSPAWEVTAYPTRADLEAQRFDEALLCPLVR